MQTSYATDPPIGRAGMVADDRLFKHVASRLMEGPGVAGRGCFRVPGYGVPNAAPSADPGQVYMTTTPAIAVDVDALVTAHASVDAGVTILPADLNGVQGTADMIPARKITVVLSNHADWDAKVGGLILKYYNAAGVLITDTFDVANGGNETHTSSDYARSFVSAVFHADAASGAGGSFTIGVAVLDTLTLADFDGVVLYDAAKESASGTLGEFATQDAVSVLQKGAVFVTTEDACAAAGDVYVRIGGSGSLGAFRSDADGGAAVQITGAKWGRTSGVGGLNVLELF